MCFMSRAMAQSVFLQNGMNIMHLYWPHRVLMIFGWSRSKLAHVSIWGHSCYRSSWALRLYHNPVSPWYMEVANFCAAMDTLIDQDGYRFASWPISSLKDKRLRMVADTGTSERCYLNPTPQNIVLDTKRIILRALVQKLWQKAHFRKMAENIMYSQMEFV